MSNKNVPDHLNLFSLTRNTNKAVKIDQNKEYYNDNKDINIVINDYINIQDLYLLFDNNDFQTTGSSELYTIKYLEFYYNKYNTSGIPSVFFNYYYNFINLNKYIGYKKIQSIYTIKNYKKNKYNRNSAFDPDALGYDSKEGIAFIIFLNNNIKKVCFNIDDLLQIVNKYDYTIVLEDNYVITYSYLCYLDYKTIEHEDNPKIYINDPDSIKNRVLSDGGHATCLYLQKNENNLYNLYHINTGEYSDKYNIVHDNNHHKMIIVNDIQEADVNKIIKLSLLLNNNDIYVSLNIDLLYYILYDDILRNYNIQYKNIFTSQVSGSCSFYSVYETFKFINYKNNDNDSDDFINYLISTVVNDKFKLYKNIYTNRQGVEIMQRTGVTNFSNVYINSNMMFNLWKIILNKYNTDKINKKLESKNINYMYNNWVTNYLSYQSGDLFKLIDPYKKYIHKKDNYNALSTKRHRVKNILDLYNLQDTYDNFKNILFYIINSKSYNFNISNINRLNSLIQIANVFYNYNMYDNFYYHYLFFNSVINTTENFNMYINIDATKNFLVLKDKKKIGLVKYLFSNMSNFNNIDYKNISQYKTINDTVYETNLLNYVNNVGQLYIYIYEQITSGNNNIASITDNTLKSIFKIVPSQDMFNDLLYSVIYAVANNINNLYKSMYRPPIYDDYGNDDFIYDSVINRMSNIYNLLSTKKSDIINSNSDDIINSFNNESSNVSNYYFMVSNTININNNDNINNIDNINIDDEHDIYLLITLVKSLYDLFHSEYYSLNNIYDNYINNNYSDNTLLLLLKLFFIYNHNNTDYKYLLNKIIKTTKNINIINFINIINENIYDELPIVKKKLFSDSRYNIISIVSIINNNFLYAINNNKVTIDDLEKISIYTEYDSYRVKNTNFVINAPNQLTPIDESIFNGFLYILESNKVIFLNNDYIKIDVLPDDYDLLYDDVNKTYHIVNVFKKYNYYFNNNYLNYIRNNFSFNYNKYDIYLVLNNTNNTKDKLLLLQSEIDSNNITKKFTIILLKYDKNENVYYPDIIYIDNKSYTVITKYNKPDIGNLLNRFINLMPFSFIIQDNNNYKILNLPISYNNLKRMYNNFNNPKWINDDIRFNNRDQFNIIKLSEKYEINNISKNFLTVNMDGTLYKNYCRFFSPPLFFNYDSFDPFYKYISFNNYNITKELSVKNYLPKHSHDIAGINEIYNYSLVNNDKLYSYILYFMLNDIYSFSSRIINIYDKIYEYLFPSSILNINKPYSIKIVEIISCNNAWEKQVKLINNIIYEVDTKNTYSVNQLLMGSGKTSFITPSLIIYYLNQAKENNIIVILPEHLVSQSQNDIINIYNSVLYDYKNSYTFISDINIKLDIINNFSNIRKYNDPNNIFIIDEFDSLYNPMNSDLNLIDNYSQTIKISDLIKININSFIPFMFNNFNTLKNNIYYKFVCGTENKIIDDTIYLECVEQFDNIKLFEETFNKCLSMRYNVDYGFPLNNSHNVTVSSYAVPYSSVLTPVNNSLFSDIDLTMILTIFLYIQSNNYNNYVISDIINFYNDETEYTNMNNKIITEYNNTKVVTPYLIDFISSSKDIIIKYVNKVINDLFIYSGQYNISFMDLIFLEKPRKIAFSGTVNILLPNYDISTFNGKKYDETISIIEQSKKDLFGGSNNRMITNIITDVESESMIENAIVGNILSTTHYIDSIDINKIFDIIDINNYNCLIDIGAFFYKISQFALVTLLKKRFSFKKFKGYIFIDSDDNKKVLDASGLNNYNSNNSYDNYFVYFDNRHIIGIDIKQSKNVKGLATLSNKDTYTRVSQGIFRLRHLDAGQTIDFICNDEKISKLSRDKLYSYLVNEELLFLLKEYNYKRILQNIKSIYKSSLLNDSYANESIFYENKYNKYLNNINDRLPKFIYTNELINELVNYYNSKNYYLVDTQMELQKNKEVESNADYIYKPQVYKGISIKTNSKPSDNLLELIINTDNYNYNIYPDNAYVINNIESFTIDNNINNWNDIISKKLLKILLWNDLDFKGCKNYYIELPDKIIIVNSKTAYDFYIISQLEKYKHINYKIKLNKNTVIYDRNVKNINTIDTHKKDNKYMKLEILVNMLLGYQESVINNKLIEEFLKSSPYYLIIIIIYMFIYKYNNKNYINKIDTVFNKIFKLPNNNSSYEINIDSYKNIKVDKPYIPNKRYVDKLENNKIAIERFKKQLNLLKKEYELNMNKLYKTNKKDIISKSDISDKTQNKILSKINIIEKIIEQKRKENDLCIEYLNHEKELFKLNNMRTELNLKSDRNSEYVKIKNQLDEDIKKHTLLRNKAVELLYKNKYLKYKEKYLLLKNEM